METLLKLPWYKRKKRCARKVHLHHVSIYLWEDDSEEPEELLAEYFLHCEKEHEWKEEYSWSSNIFFEDIIIYPYQLAEIVGRNV